VFARLGSLLLAITLAASTASSETTYYTQRDDFLADAGPVGLGSFEDLPVCLELECRGKRIEQPNFTLSLIARPAAHVRLRSCPVR